MHKFGNLWTVFGATARDCQNYRPRLSMGPWLRQKCTISYKFWLSKSADSQAKNVHRDPFYFWAGFGQVPLQLAKTWPNMGWPSRDQARGPRFSLFANNNLLHLPGFAPPVCRQPELPPPLKQGPITSFKNAEVLQFMDGFRRHRARLPELPPPLNHGPMASSKMHNFIQIVAIEIGGFSNGKRPL